MTKRLTLSGQATSLVVQPQTVRDPDKLSVPEKLALIPGIRLYPKPIAQVTSRLDYLMHSPPTGVLLTGPKNVGKATLLAEFAKRYPIIVREDLPNDLQPVVFATPTSRVDAVGIADAIARDAGWPHFTGASQKAPEHLVDFLLQKSETKVLLLYHAEMLADGRGKFRSEALPFIVNVRDRATATFCLVGDDSLVDIVKASGLADSFFKRLSLKPMDFDAEWKKLIKNLKAQLPFDFSVLDLPHMDLRLHRASDGKIPMLMNYVHEAALAAVYDDKTLVIALKHFEKAYTERCSGQPNPFDPKCDVATLHEPVEDVPRTAASDALRIANRRGN